MADDVDKTSLQAALKRPDLVAARRSGDLEFIGSPGGVSMAAERPKGPKLDEADHR